MAKNLFNEQMEKFLNYARRNKKFSKNTVDAYRNDIIKFADYLNKRNIKDFAKVNEKIVKDYVNLMHEELKERSVFRNVSSLRGFYSYLIRKKIYKGKNPFYAVMLKKTEPQQPTVLPVKDIKKLFKVLREDGFINLRNKVIVLFIYSTGLRATEVLNAKIENLNLRKGTYKCEMGGRERTVYFSKELVPILRKYLKERKKYMSAPTRKNNKVNYLFVNKQGGRLTRQTIYMIVQTAGEDADLKEKVTPSILRNSLAWHLLSSGTNRELIKEMFGYKTIIPDFGEPANVKRVRFPYLTTHPAFRKK
jgi:site-specific recombinase XerD